MSRRFALVVSAMLLGVLVGWLCHNTLSPSNLQATVAGLSEVTDIFLRLIKMIIAPLVLATLVAGIGHMESAASVGRIGAKTMIWFLGASLTSLGLGLLMVHLLRPGEGVLLSVAAESAAPSMAGFSLQAFIGHVVPTSIVEAMAKNEILQIVVFSLFAGTAVAQLEGRAPHVMEFADQVAAIMLKITDYIMKLAPVAIFASIAANLATQGPTILATYAKFIASFYLSLGILSLVLLLAGAAVLRGAVLPLVLAIRTPALIAFSCASSEVAFPKLLDALPKAGVPRQIASFVLPLGYSFNLDATMMYCTFATMFIVQAHGLHLSLGQQMGMALMLLITSKGIAAVPRASLVVIMATLSAMGLPESWILVVLAVDHLLDMGRAGANVLGNSVASAVVARWEGQFCAPVRPSLQKSAPPG